MTTGRGKGSVTTRSGGRPGQPNLPPDRAGPHPRGRGSLGRAVVLLRELARAIHAQLGPRGSAGWERHQSRTDARAGILGPSGRGGSGVFGREGPQNHARGSRARDNCRLQLHSRDAPADHAGRLSLLLVRDQQPAHAPLALPRRCPRRPFATDQGAESHVPAPDHRRAGRPACVRMGHERGIQGGAGAVRSGLERDRPEYHDLRSAQVGRRGALVRRSGARPLRLDPRPRFGDRPDRGWRDDPR